MIIYYQLNEVTSRHEIWVGHGYSTRLLCSIPEELPNYAQVLLVRFQEVVSCSVSELMSQNCVYSFIDIDWYFSEDMKLTHGYFGITGLILFAKDCYEN